MAVSLNIRRDQSIVASGAFLEREGFSQLSVEELQVVGKKFIAGWACPIQIERAARRLIVLCSENYPGEIPEFFLDPFEDLIFKIPHLDSDGKICVLPDYALTDQGRPADVMEHLLGNARKIIFEPELSDFTDEFDHYWVLAKNFCTDQLHLLYLPSNYGSEAVAYHIGNKVFVGKDKKVLGDWITRYSGNRFQSSRICPALVCYLKNAIQPTNFPKTVTDIQSLVYDDSVARQRLEEHLSVSSKLLFLLLIQQTNDGEIFGGVAIHPSKLAFDKSITHGFRPGKIPASIASKRGSSILASKTVNLLKVQRVDHQWIHTRGGDGVSLLGKRVTIVGAGSLGGYVTHLIARSGVSHIEIIDPDILSWDNVGRHVLGGQEVGCNKAAALHKKLAGELPHLEINSHAFDWRTTYRENPAIFLESDLIISTVANWGVEHDLNYLNRQIGNCPPVIFAWIEPYAVAGHSIAVLPVGGCFACGMDSMGAFLYPIATFPKVTTRPQPGGCGVFQQYGPTSMMPIAAMVADCAISVLLNRTNRSEIWTWLGKEEILKENSGVWSSQGRSFVGESGAEKLYRKRWSKNGGCKLCV